jgi:hypothetical protein
MLVLPIWLRGHGHDCSPWGQDSVVFGQTV